MRRLTRLALLLAFALLWDWAPYVPPIPIHAVAQAKGQARGPDRAGYPPERTRPYFGATNCIQVVDLNGNFSCSPLATIDPNTGQFNAVLNVTSAPGALVIGPVTGVVALGNDFVLTKQAYTTTAPTGPGINNGVTLRVRPSPRIPGYCQIVAIAGNSFGQALEFPLAFQSPTSPSGGSQTGGAVLNLYDTYVIDLPGGPGGC